MRSAGTARVPGRVVVYLGWCSKGGREEVVVYPGGVGRHIDQGGGSSTLRRGFSFSQRKEKNSAQRSLLLPKERGRTLLRGPSSLFCSFHHFSVPFPSLFCSFLLLFVRTERVNGQAGPSVRVEKQSELSLIVGFCSFCSFSSTFNSSERFRRPCGSVRDIKNCQ